jgi:Chitin binding Peritrophin-A domain
VLLPLAIVLLQLATTVVANPCAGNTGIVFVPADNCEEYYTCVDEEAFPQKCPPGFYFDVGRQMCYFSDQVNCDGGPAGNPCAGRPQFTFVPRPNGGCGAYYRCDNEIGVPLDCPEGFFFDEPNQKCNFADEVVCDNSPPTAPTPVPTGPTDPSSTDGTVPPPTSCVGRPDGSFVADPPRGCTAFLRCNGGVGEAFFCDAPFHFDFAGQMCNWPEVVNCQFAS